MTAPGDGEITVSADETMGEQDWLLAGVDLCVRCCLRPDARHDKLRVPGGGSH